MSLIRMYCYRNASSCFYFDSGRESRSVGAPQIVRGDCEDARGGCVFFIFFVGDFCPSIGLSRMAETGFSTNFGVHINGESLRLTIFDAST